MLDRVLSSHATDMAFFILKLYIQSVESASAFFAYM